jgi:F0F1-type ATP synthase assembly protein I
MPNPEPTKSRPFNTYLKYSSVGFQILASLLLFTWLGQWLDKKAGNEQPWITILLIFLALGGSFYQLYRSVKVDEKEDAA